MSVRAARSTPGERRRARAASGNMTSIVDQRQDQRVHDARADQVGDRHGRTSATCRDRRAAARRASSSTARSTGWSRPSCVPDRGDRLRRRIASEDRRGRVARQDLGRGEDRAIETSESIAMPAARPADDEPDERMDAGRAATGPAGGSPVGRRRSHHWLDGLHERSGGRA